MILNYRTLWGIIISVMVALCIGGVPCANADGTIVQGRAASGSIVTPDSPTKAEQFAAEEIQTYLEKMSGAKVPIVRSDIPAQGGAIVVGAHPAAASVQSSLKRFSNSSEAFAVVGAGDRLFLVGNGESATLYAAWDWLESLGVRWIMPGEHGTLVPSRDTVTFSDGEKFDKPGVAWRGPGFAINPGPNEPPGINNPEHGVAGSNLYSYRMRMSNAPTFDMADSYILVGGGHSYEHFLPKSRYLKDHPDWYNTVNGKLVADQVNFTSREAAAEFAKNMLVEVKNYLAKGAKLDHLQLFVSPNDGQARCDNPECRRLLDSDGSATSMVVHFANLVADEVHKIYPIARIVFYAYANYERPPDHERPGPNVCPQVTEWTAVNSAHANLAHPMFSPANDKFRNYFNEWSRMSDGISAYAYYGHYVWFTPWPQLTQMSVDISSMARDRKFYGMFSENHQHWATQAPNFYLYSKLLWNPGLDVRKTMDDYYRAAFGPASGNIQAYFDILQGEMDRATYIGGDIMEVPTFLSDSICRQCDQEIDSAASRLRRMDADTKWRTELVIQGWRDSEKFAEAVRHYQSTPDPQGDRARIAASLQEVSDTIESPFGRWEFEHGQAKHTVDTLLQPVSKDFTALPAGDHAVHDSLSYGGMMKFMADVRGFTYNRYGYLLKPGGHGSMQIPVTAESGRRLKSLTVRAGWVVQDPSVLAVTVTAIGADGTRAVLASDVVAASAPMTVPASLLGQKVVIALDIINQGAKTLIPLTGFHTQVGVE